MLLSLQSDRKKKFHLKKRYKFCIKSILLNTFGVFYSSDHSSRSTTTPAPVITTVPTLAPVTTTVPTPAPVTTAFPSPMTSTNRSSLCAMFLRFEKEDNLDNINLRFRTWSREDKGVRELLPHIGPSPS